MKKRFVGFGFGPIQTGLFLWEAMASGNFDDYLVAEVDQRIVDAVRRAGNRVTINVAGRDGVRHVTLDGLRICNPGVDEDRAEIVRGIAEAEELATAIPSVSLYAAGGKSSIAALLAEGIDPDRPRIVYTAENNNFAAELLGAEVALRAPAARLARLQLLNTVIGKMSGVISSPEEMRELGLEPLAAGFDRCVLVEEFNRILISRIRLPGFRRGIDVFEEKDDLLPFEEAKLFGHNAVHALLGFLAQRRGLEAMSAIRDDPWLLAAGRRAFIEESGAALVAKHGRGGDALFTADGWRAYAEDLLARMTNPWLRDRVERVIRDPRRKLAWGDRFFGTMRECLRQGIEPRTMASGAAAAVDRTTREETGRPADADAVRTFLPELWKGEPDDGLQGECLRLVERALGELP